MPNPRNTASQVASEGIGEGIHTSKTLERKESDSTRIVKKRVPNATELEYNRIYLLGCGEFEKLTLNLPGGSRYKPDWVSVSTMRIHDSFTQKVYELVKVTCHEVKGSFRFWSHGRARTAFREAVAAFPEFAFVWATKKADGSWEIERHGV